ncbi:MAG: type II toxin-antitoxin system RelE/ParE family toxin [Candidatus Accumulibacter similis]|nr:MAG: type II toxin-antitoxin system RelE/ParE family toxin [Candidatus Accumulibacter similis]
MKLVVAPLALAELHDAATFYALQATAELGPAFVAEFERTANLVLANPLLGAVFRDTRRRYTLRRFPYSIIHQVGAEEIWILAVAHHRRRPGYWGHRK